MSNEDISSMKWSLGVDFANQKTSTAVIVLAAIEYVGGKITQIYFLGSTSLQLNQESQYYLSKLKPMFHQLKGPTKDLQVVTPHGTYTLSSGLTIEEKAREFRDIVRTEVSWNETSGEFHSEREQSSRDTVEKDLR